MKPELCFTSTHPSTSYQIIPIREPDMEGFFSSAPSLVKTHLRLQQFQGKTGDIAFALGEDSSSIVYVGIGQDNWEEAFAKISTKLAPGYYHCNTSFPLRAGINWGLAQYVFDAYKPEENVRVLVLSEEILTEILPVLQSIYLARDLINRPANDLTPKALAEVVFDLSDLHEAHYEQWVGDDLIEGGFRAIYAVGKAGHEEPRLSRLTWGQESHPKLTLVGKGVCFDSGGLDIKPSANMRLMKKDMGGAAIALALAHWIMSVKLPVSLEVLIASVENSVGSDAYRPGDVITMRNGLTVEIDNTDAEGRLILADALDFACERMPELLIDFSTLTGAARVAVGTEISALFCNDNRLAEGLLSAGEETQDYIWRLPLFKPYQKMLDSKIADLVNSSPSSYAGAITAALFLERFVHPSIHWAHFDVMAWNVSAKPGKPEGGEAMSFLAVSQFLNKYFRKN